MPGQIRGFFLFVFMLHGPCALVSNMGPRLLAVGNLGLAQRSSGVSSINIAGFGTSLVLLLANLVACYYPLAPIGGR